MPVLIERLSLVLPAGALHAAEAAGHRPAGMVSRADDGEVVSLSFDSVLPAQAALEELAASGLSPRDDEEPGDVAVVDHRVGPALWWPWIELAVVPAPGDRRGRVLLARLAGSGRRDVVAPPGWAYPGSASARQGVPPLSASDRPLRYLRRVEAAGVHADLYEDRWTGEEVRLPRDGPRRRVRVEALGGGGEVLADVVSRPEEIEVGLMHRRALAPDDAMLFRFPVVRRHAFWTKNTLVPLDLLFLGAGGRVESVARRTEPMRLRTHRPRGPVKEVLEVPGGWCDAHGVGEGARVVVVE